MPIATKRITTAKSLSIAESSAIYDRIYDIADRLFKRYNPCSIHIIDGGIGCTSRKTSIAYGLCCSSCKYISKIGCTVKCLPCKLFVCDRLLCVYDKKNRWIRNKKYIHFTNKINRLRKIAREHSICTYEYFKTKKEVLNMSRR